jgi:hypothetical protein
MLTISTAGLYLDQGQPPIEVLGLAFDEDAPRLPRWILVNDPLSGPQMLRYVQQRFTRAP